MLPTPNALIQQMPLTPDQQRFVAESRTVIQQILSGEDSRLLIIVGPCSVHDPVAIRDYAQRLRDFAETVSDRFFIVMRAYFEKPRTTVGWKGFLYDPHLDGSHDIGSALPWTRQLLLHLVALGMPTATEFLDPSMPNYLGDLISWGVVGARTTASQPHRQMASGLPMATGFKNTTDGDIDVAIHAVLSARTPHSFIGLNPHGQPSVVHTSGNPHTHVVLRGGGGEINYDEGSIAYTARRLREEQLSDRLVIDCSHDNSAKDHKRQIIAFRHLIEQVVQGNTAIAGVLLESYLNAGCQPLPRDRSALIYGTSLTDPCIDWPTTKYLLEWAYEKMGAEVKVQKASAI